MQHIVINELLCDGCATCIDDCPTEGVYMEDGQAHIDSDECTVCGLCIPGCHVRAISMEDVPE